MLIVEAHVYKLSKQPFCKVHKSIYRFAVDRKIRE